MRIFQRTFLSVSMGALVLCQACGGGSARLVDEAPVFLSQPASQTIYSGGTATFTVSANGYPPPTISWERSNDAGTTWVPITGATTTSYSFTVQPPDTGAEIRAVASNPLATIRSLPAVLKEVPAVYAAGMIDVTNPFAGYWINGTWVGLSNPLYPSGGWVNSLAVSAGPSGNNVYVAGSDGFGSPGYWLNGSWVGLPTGYTGPGSGIVNSLCLNGGVVFAAGNSIDSTNSRVLGYWLNGTWVGLTLPSGFTPGQLSAMVESGEIIDIAGYLLNSSTDLVTPGYWSNGTWVGLTLSSGSVGGVATGLALSESGTYVAGYTFPAGGSGVVPGYWLNGTWMGLPLPQGSNAGTVTTLVVAGDMVYAGGMAGTIDASGYWAGTLPGYWLNGTWTGLPLPAGSDFGQAQSLVLSGGRVYVGGDVYAQNSSGYLTSCIPGYWVDGEWTALPIPAGSNPAGTVGTSWVNALVVIP